MIFLKIKEDILAAMKNGEKDKMAKLRYIMAEIQKAAVDSVEERDNISDELSLKILEKAAKARKESIKIYTEQNRPDLAEPERIELELIQKYLPEQMTDEELNRIIEKVKSENLDLQGMAIMGKVMPLVKGKADPDRIKKALGF